MSGEITARKGELRTRMRELRRSLDGGAERSIRLWSFVRVEPGVRAARTVMLFDSMAGEPDTSSFAEWCTSVGKHVVTPGTDPHAEFPADPRSIDLVVVPGVAFTVRGDRLGQGGGWYDRFLSLCRSDVVSIGVCFDEQIVPDIPVEPHDVRMTAVITPSGAWRDELHQDR